jgi:hypothetical protein
MALSVIVLAQQAPSQNITWVRQFGTSADDFGFGVTSHTSGSYLGGYTNESVNALAPCRTSVSSASVATFLRRYSPSGVVTLTDPAAPFETIYDVAVGSNGLHYAVGGGAGLAFVRSYSGAGVLQQGVYFVDLVGTSKAFGVAVDASGVYVVGSVVTGPTSSDVVVRKLNILDLTDVEWTVQLASSEISSATAVAVDGGGVYVAGYTGLTEPSLNSADGFVNKYDAGDGTLIWASTIGTPADDFAFGVTVDFGSVYASGYTAGQLPSQISSGLNDAFVRKIDAATGGVLWTSQFGTASDDFALSVAANASGVYVAGYTGGALGAQVGDSDGYVRKYDTLGAVQWTKQFGSTEGDVAWDVALDGSAAYLSGCTAGDFGSASAGGSDAYLAKLEPGPVTVSIDIRPEAYPNSINLGSNGVVQVGILSSATFDARDVDPSTVFLADATVKLKGNGSSQASLQDVNGDTLVDLVVHVVTQALALTANDTIAVLTGKTYWGQTVTGQDSVRIVP